MKHYTYQRIIIDLLVALVAIMLTFFATFFDMKYYWWWRHDLLDLMVELFDGDPQEYGTTLRKFFEVTFLIMPSVVFSVAIYCMLSLIACRKTKSKELRCINCGYLLKGLSKPQCPECGAKL